MSNKTRTFVTVSQVSIDTVEQMWELICDQHEHDFARKAYREGFGLVTKVKHTKTLEFGEFEETGETYEFYTIRSSAEVQQLEDAK